MFADIYRDKKVLVTGHTGFKGSWLTFWLSQLGARVNGLALPPDTEPSHWEILDLPIVHQLSDVRQFEVVSKQINDLRPDMVFHLAAQPLVRRSYHEPLETWSSNVMGTANVLEACRHSDSVKAIVVVTSDKCYENLEQAQGYTEQDRLGGHDPYSASKAATELLVSSYRASYFDQMSVLVASVRAGNVIGGGDWSEDRLIPDTVRSIVEGRVLQVRSPQSSRPWQHVLDSLSGYLQLGQQLLAGEALFADAWNFGPEKGRIATVSEVLDSFSSHWPAFSWQQTEDALLHETRCLGIDSQKARQQLGWASVWSLPQSVQYVAEWYRHYIERGVVKTAEQWQQYLQDAEKAEVAWL